MHKPGEGQEAHPHPETMSASSVVPSVHTAPSAHEGLGAIAQAGPALAPPAAAKEPSPEFPLTQNGPSFHIHVQAPSHLICRTAYTFEAKCQCTPGMDDPCDLAKRQGGKNYPADNGSSEVGPNEWATVWSRKEISCYFCTFLSFPRTQN